MSFGNKDEYTAGKKQHLNLSYFAHEVVESDRFAFNENLSGFLNKILEYYAPRAEASISQTLSAYEGDLEKTLSGTPGDEKTKRKLIKRLLKQREEILIQKNDSYEKGHSFKFWINQKNFEYLTGEDSECSEDIYYGARQGKYIKCIIEEYARLPYIERELIFFTPFLEAIREAIRIEKRLRIETQAGKVYSVYPYDIRRDPLSTANYLAGYSKSYNCPEDEKKLCSFRISALKSVKLEKSKSAFLKECEKKLLDEKLSSRGVQFLVGGEEEILIRLTPEGINKYNRQMHLRPALKEKQEDGVYVFNCTMAQAQFYFFKFGKDAEILSPPALREKFAAMYREASRLYSADQCPETEYHRASP